MTAQSTALDTYLQRLPMILDKVEALRQLAELLEQNPRALLLGKPGGRPGPVLIDLPFDVQMAEIEFDIDTYEPLPVYKPAATRAQISKALDLMAAAERPLSRASFPQNARAAVASTRTAEVHTQAMTRANRIGPEVGR